LKYKISAVFQKSSYASIHEFRARFRIVFTRFDAGVQVLGEGGDVLGPGHREELPRHRFSVGFVDKKNVGDLERGGAIRDGERNFVVKDIQHLYIYHV
jgi:hypothetical protein